MPRTTPEKTPETIAVDRMPVEELSRRSGVTVRNLRELQTRGLLEPPLLQGRKGFYTQRHLARVMLVRTLQDRGYTLASITDLLEQWKGTIGPFGVMHLEDGVSTPGLPGARRLDEAGLLELLPELRASARLLEQALGTELVCRDADGALYAPNAEQIAITRALADIGMPLHVQFADFHLLRKELEVMVRRFRERFQEHVLAKLERAHVPAKGLEELATRLAHVRPAVVRGVAIALSAALERGGPIKRVASAAPAIVKPARAAKPRKPARRAR